MINITFLNEALCKCVRTVPNPSLTLPATLFINYLYEKDQSLQADWLIPSWPHSKYAVLSLTAPLHLIVKHLMYYCEARYYLGAEKERAISILLPHTYWHSTPTTTGLGQWLASCQYSLLITNQPGVTLTDRFLFPTSLGSHRSICASSYAKH